MKRKIMVYVFFNLLVMLFLAGCQTPVSNTDVSSNDETIRIVMIPKLIGISYFDKCAEGAREVAEAYGMEFIYKGPTTADAASQVNIIQDMIYNDVDVIAIAPNDPDAVKPILQKAKDKGIIVVTFDADAAVESRDVFVSQVSEEVFGRHLITNMAELMENQGKYVIMTTSMTADNQNAWIEWIKTYGEAYEDLELLTIIPNDEDQQKAYANTRNLIQAYPELDGIMAISTVVGPGVAQAVEALGENGEIKLLAVSLPNDLRPYIESDAVQLGTLWSPYHLGALTMEVANRLAKNEAIIDGEMFGDIGPIQYDEGQKVVIMGEPLDFTKDNINDYDF